MSSPSLVSLETNRSGSRKSAHYVPHVLGGTDDLRSIASAASPRLTRQSTAVSELSRIWSGLRDDKALDQQEQDAYKSAMGAEESLARYISEAAESGADNASAPSAGEPADDRDHPLDGYFAFWQAFLVMFMTFATWGANSAFGVFLNYYLTASQFANATKYHWALMGGVVVFLGQVLAPLSVLCVRVLGHTPVHIAGICVQTVAYFLAAECTSLWQLIVCQGVLVGISFSLLFIPGTIIIPTWFEKRRALAMGIAIAGSGLGGLVYSLSLSKIIQDTGNQKWALRTVGFINLALSVFGTAFLRPRNGQKIQWKHNLRWGFIRDTMKTMFNFTCFRCYPMVLIALWFGVCTFSYIIVLYSLPAYATTVGLTTTQGSHILAILNVFQAVGRPAIGTLGDNIGRTNTAVLSCLFLAVMILSLWLNATSFGAIVALTVVGGPVGIGSIMSQAISMDILKLRGMSDKLPAVWGGLNIVVSLFSLPSELVALGLKRGSGKRSFVPPQIFTGCCFFLAACMALVVREWLVRHTLLHRRSVALDQLYSARDGHLRAEDLHKEKTPGDAVLTARVERYNRMLHKSVPLFFVRMFYPIRV